ncbi:MAG: hypothetical protein AAF591_16005 [Verrucomicrobiota bacterium]
MKRTLYLCGLSAFVCAFFLVGLSLADRGMNREADGMQLNEEVPMGADVVEPSLAAMPIEPAVVR